MQVNIKHLVVALSAVTLAFGAGVSAQAQDTQRVQKPFRIKIGGFFPSDGNVKDTVGKNLFGYGLSYDFLKTRAANPIIAGVYIDGAFKSDEETIGGQEFDAEYSYTGIGIQGRTYFLPLTPETSTNFYAGAGIGAYTARVKGSTRQGNLTISASESSTKFGGKVFTGVELKQGFFGEADYTFADSVKLGEENFNLNGFNLSIGYRF